MKYVLVGGPGHGQTAEVETPRLGLIYPASNGPMPSHVHYTVISWELSSGEYIEVLSSVTSPTFSAIISALAIAADVPIQGEAVGVVRHRN